MNADSPHGFLQSIRYHDKQELTKINIKKQLSIKQYWKYKCLSIVGKDGPDSGADRR